MTHFDLNHYLQSRSMSEMRVLTTHTHTHTLYTITARSLYRIARVSSGSCWDCGLWLDHMHRRVMIDACISHSAINLDVYARTAPLFKLLWYVDTYLYLVQQAIYRTKAKEISHIYVEEARQKSAVSRCNYIYGHPDCPMYIN